MRAFVTDNEMLLGEPEIAVGVGVVVESVAGEIIGLELEALDLTYRVK